MKSNNSKTNEVVQPRYGGTMKGLQAKGWELFGIVFIIVVAVGAAAYGLAGGYNVHSIGAPGSPAPVSLNGSTGTCTLASGYPKIAFRSTYVDPTNNYQVTQAAAAVNAIDVNVNPSVVSFTNSLTATGYAYWNASVNCGDVIKTYVGENANYYIIPLQPVAVTHAITYITTGSLLKMANIKTPSFNNATTFGSSTAILNGMAASQTDTSTAIKLQENGGNYGVQNICVGFAANTLYVKNVQLLGATQITGCQVGANVPTGYTAYTWQIPALSNSTNWYNQATYGIQVQTTSSFTGTVNTPINVWVKDKANFLQNGNLTLEYFNSNNQAVGQALTQVTNGIFVMHS